MSQAKVLKKSVLVTGGNKGLGYAMCERLIKEHGNTIGVLLVGAREEKRAQTAIESLAKLKDPKSSDELVLKYVHIDLEDEKSIIDAAEKIRTDYGGLNVLINNAGMSSQGDAFDEKIATTTLRNNYTGTKYMIQHFLPVLAAKPDSRIVSVSTTVARTATRNMGAELQKSFLKDDLTVAELDDLMTKFVTAVQNGTFWKDGWPKTSYLPPPFSWITLGSSGPKTAYAVSKIGVNMLTRVYGRDMKSFCDGWRKQANDAKTAVHEPTISCCCPGFVKTDLTGGRGFVTPAEGADTAVWLATTPRSDNKSPVDGEVMPSDPKIHGRFFYLRKPQPWM